jgi:hypothetical protein
VSVEKTPEGSVIRRKYTVEFTAKGWSEGEREAKKQEEFKVAEQLKIEKLRREKERVAKEYSYARDSIENKKHSLTLKNTPLFTVDRFGNPQDGRVQRKEDRPG